MYAYIIGNVTKLTPRNIVLENNQIGYIITVPNPYNFRIGDNVKIFTYQYVREDINELYGFSTETDHELFIKLISVNGIGPKSALSMLASGNSLEIIKAIENRNDTYLRKFPGIGPKASQQIILDLQGKVCFDENSSKANIADSKLNDCEEALLGLGYSQKEVNKVLKDIDKSLDSGEIIKAALRLMVK